MRGSVPARPADMRRQHAARTRRRQHERPMRGSALTRAADPVGRALKSLPASASGWTIWCWRSSSGARSSCASRGYATGKCGAGACTACIGALGTRVSNGALAWSVSEKLGSAKTTVREEPRAIVFTAGSCGCPCKQPSDV